MKKKLSVIIGILLTFFSIYIFVYGIDIHIGKFKYVIEKIDWNEVGKNIVNLNIFWFVLAVVVSQLPFLFRIFRLHEIIGSQKSEVKDIAKYTILGFGANNLLPARAGEFLKAYLIKKKYNYSYISALNVIFVERIFDSILMAIFAWLSVGWMSGVISKSSALYKYLGLIQLFATIGMIGLVFFLFFLMFVKNLKFSLLPTKIANSLIEEIKTLREFLFKENKLELIKILINSLFVWITLSMGIWFLFKAFDINLSLKMGFFIEIMIGFSVALPQAPGYLGVFQIACAESMLIFGIDSNVAKSFAILLWVIQIIPVTLTTLIMAFFGEKLIVSDEK